MGLEFAAGTMTAAYLLTFIGNLLGKLLYAGIIAGAGWLIMKLLLKAAQKFLKHSKIDTLLHSIILSTLKILMLVFIAIAVVDALGIPTTSLVTALGAVGLAISLAVKDSIASLAGGIIILITKPFTIGDYVEIDSTGGTVREMGLFDTILTTPDNKRITLPNDIVSKAKITNYSSEPLRRLDLTFSIGYNDDYSRAKALIEEVVKQNPLAQKTPEPVVRMTEHAASSINIVCRVWVENANYYELRFTLLEEVKKAFDSNGINIPYNQLDVHLHSEK